MTIHFSKIEPPDDRQPQPSPLIVQHLLFRLEKAQRMMRQADDEVTLVRKFLEELQEGK